MLYELVQSNTLKCTKIMLKTQDFSMKYEDMYSLEHAQFRKMEILVEIVAFFQLEIKCVGSCIRLST